MRLTVDAKALRQALETVLPVIVKKPTIPVLASARIVASGDTLEVTGTDLQTAVIRTIGATVEESGACLVPAHRLRDVLKTAPKGASVTIQHDVITIPEIGENGEYLGTKDVHADHTDFTIGAANIRLEAMDIASYPKLPKAPPSDATLFSGADLARVVDLTCYAISAEESRFTLNGALLQVKDGAAEMVATDGHRLARAFTGALGPDFRALIPKQALVIASKEWRKLDGAVALRRDENHVFLAGVNSTTIIARVLVGNFPDYERAIPAQERTPHTLAVDRDAFIAAIKRALPAAKAASNRKGGECLKMTWNGCITLEVGAGPEVATYRDSIEAAWDGPTDTIAAFNPLYVLDVLNGAPGIVTIRTKADDASEKTDNLPAITGPAVFDMSGAQAVVMPMRL